MNIRQYLIIAALVVSLSGCVSKKIYKDLEARHNDAIVENKALSLENQKNLSESNRLKGLYQDISKDLSSLQSQSAKDISELNDLRKKYSQAQSDFQNLIKSKENLLDASSKQAREYLDAIKAKEDNIDKLQSELSRKEADLRSREQRVAQLEGMISEIQTKLSSLKNELMKALVGFEGKGLTISQRNGKIYVSLDNKLLFPSGSWSVNAEGKRAIDQISRVLVSQPDLKVMIEGHTDNVPYRASGSVKDNWDLSVLRATSIVRLIQANLSIDPKNITAAGRSEYEPMKPNSSADGRAANRRTEIIITPDLSVIEKMLSELDI